VLASGGVRAPTRGGREVVIGTEQESTDGDQPNQGSFPRAAIIPKLGDGTT
jgi:hypothetical protein